MDYDNIMIPVTLDDPQGATCMTEHVDGRRGWAPISQLDMASSPESSLDESVRVTWEDWHEGHGPHDSNWNVNIKYLKWDEDAVARILAKHNIKIYDVSKATVPFDDITKEEA